MSFDESKLYETIFYILPDTVLLIDNKGQILEINNRAEEWLGYKADEIVGYNILKLPFITTKGKVTVAKKFADRMIGKKVEPYELEFKTKTGEIKTGLIRANVIEDKDGHKEDLVLIADTTKDKMLTAQIADVERKYKYLFDKIIYGYAYHRIVLNDKKEPIDYIFLEVNDIFTEMTGLEKDKILNKKITEVLPEIDKDNVRWISVYGEVAKNRRPIRFEGYVKDLNKWFLVSAYSPEEGYFATIFQDITDEKGTQKELEKSTNEIVVKMDEIERLNKIMENREIKLEELRQKLGNK